jgi:hypothetical protein
MSKKGSGEALLKQKTAPAKFFERMQSDTVGRYNPHVDLATPYLP